MAKSKLSEADSKSLTELERLKAAAASARKPFDSEYWLNTSFFLGQQHVQYSPAKDSIVGVPRREGEENSPRPVANKIMHYTVKSHAEAVAHDPRPEVLAPTVDAADRSEARVAQAYLIDLLGAGKIGWDSVRSDGLMWAVTAGEAWFKWVYDTQLKRPTAIACSPFDIYPDPYVGRADLARYVIHSQFMDREQVYDVYGKEVAAASGRDPAKAEILSALGYEPRISGVTVNELWMLPSRRFPKGRFVTWTNSGELLTPLGGDLPYEHGMLPFTHIGVVQVPGSMHCHAFTKFLRPPQMELNATHAQMLTSRKNFASPKVFMDSEMANSLVAPWSDAPNQVLIGDTQAGRIPPPTIIQPTTMLDDGSARWIVEEMGDIVGQHAVSEGQAPGRVDSARALELLKAEDSTHLSHLRATMEASVARGCHMLLQLARQYVREEAIVATYTRMGAPEVHKFKGTKVSRDHVVRVSSQAALPQSKAAKQELALSYWTAQIITDQRQMQEMLELPFSPGVPQEQDVLAATNENFTMLEGDPVTPNQWDEHDTHIREHNMSRKSAEFAAAPDEVRSIFEFHIEAHEAMWLEELQKEGERQATIASFAQPAGADPSLEAAPAPPPAGPPV